MKVTNPALLRTFLGTACEACGSQQGTVAHHIRTRSSGRLDVEPNLIGLCFTCHQSHHNGHEPKTNECWRIVADRYGVRWQAVRDAVDAIRRPTCDRREMQSLLHGLCGDQGRQRIDHLPPRPHEPREGGDPGLVDDQTDGGWRRF